MEVDKTRFPADLRGRLSEAEMTVTNFTAFANVGVTSLLIGPNPNRIWASFVNDTNGIVYIKLGDEGVGSDSGISLVQWGSFEIGRDNPWTGPVYGVTPFVACTIAICEISRGTR